MRYNLRKRLSARLGAVMAIAAVITGCSSGHQRADLGSPPPQPMTRAPVPMMPTQPSPWTSPTAPFPVSAPPHAAVLGPGTNHFRPPSNSTTHVIVLYGDTLYGISRRHNVSIAALMKVNRLQSAALIPGQALVLPR
jgi:hypothetical protein